MTTLPNAKQASCLACVVVLAAGSLTSAQERQLDRRLDDFRKRTRVVIDPATPAGERLLVDGGAYITLNYLSLDDSALENRVLRQYDFTLYGRANIDNVHELFLRGRTSFRNFNDGDTFGDSGNNDWRAAVERAYYRFDLQRYLGAYRGEESENSLVIKGGRDLVYWANGLTLAQTLDGVVIDAGCKALELELIAGVTPYETVDIDTSRPDFNTHTQRGFFGGLATLNAGDQRPFGYFLAQRDYNDDRLVLTSPGIPDLGSENELQTITTRYEYNSYYIGIGSAGPLSDHVSYGIEAVAEFGDTLSNSFTTINEGGSPRIVQAEQEKDSIRAFALDLLIDYAPPERVQPRFSAEFLLATGDDDRGHPTNTFAGNQAGTTDTAFNGFGLLNTGLAFAPEVTNLIMLRAGASFVPFPEAPAFEKLQLGVDLFCFGKFEADAPIAERTSDDRYLGFEPDLYLNWQISSDVSLALRYGIFFPGDAIENDDRPRQFFFAGMSFAL